MIMFVKKLIKTYHWCPSLHLTPSSSPSASGIPPSPTPGTRSHAAQCTRREAQPPQWGPSSKQSPTVFPCWSHTHQEEPPFNKEDGKGGYQSPQLPTHAPAEGGQNLACPQWWRLAKVSRSHPQMLLQAEKEETKKCWKLNVTSPICMKWLEAVWRTLPFRLPSWGAPAWFLSRGKRAPIPFQSPSRLETASTLQSRGQSWDLPYNLQCSANHAINLWPTQPTPDPEAF